MIEQRLKTVMSELSVGEAVPLGSGVDAVDIDRKALQVSDENDVTLYEFNSDNPFSSGFKFDDLSNPNPDNPFLSEFMDRSKTGADNGTTA